MSLLRSLLFVLLVAATLPLGACRGDISSKPPIHPQQNMDQQNRFDAQEPSDFWTDGRSARGYVEGTVQSADWRGDSNPCTLPEANRHLCEGTADDGSWVLELPAEVPLDADTLARGQDRYDIYCAPCHDRTGSADGMVARRGMKPVSFHGRILRSREPGKIYDTITSGGSIMPSYAAQIPVEDRWAIVAYVRALQISQHASIEVVPDDVARSQGWK